MKGALVALAIALLGAIVTPGRVDGLFGFAGSILPQAEKQAMSFTEKEGREILLNVRHSEVWQEPPQLSRESFSYLQRHFRYFDPWRPHEATLPLAPLLWPDQLVAEFPLWMGRPISVVGQVLKIDVEGFGRPGLAKRPRSRGPAVTYMAQLGLPAPGSPVIYCMFSGSADRHLYTDGWAMVTGIPLAVGSVDTNIGGFADGAFLLAAAYDPIHSPQEAQRGLRMVERARAQGTFPPGLLDLAKLN